MRYNTFTCSRLFASFHFKTLKSNNFVQKEKRARNKLQIIQTAKAAGAAERKK